MTTVTYRRYAAVQQISPPPDQSVDARLSRYFAGRAVELVQMAKLMQDPLTRIQVERVAAEFWSYSVNRGV